MGLLLTKDRTDGYGPDAVVTPAGTVLYAGKVLKTGSREVRVMSDVWSDEVYATVWTGTGTLDVPYGIYEFGINGVATVDATPEVVAAANDWRLATEVAKLRASALSRAAKTLADVEEAAATVRKGREVTVVKGRKVPKGTTGEVIWIGAGHYGSRVGVKDAAGTVHWTATSNVKVTDPAKYRVAVTPELPPTDAELVVWATANIEGADRYSRGGPGWFAVKGVAA